SGNPFLEADLCIARLDHLARNDELQAKLAQSDWDLIVCDEAHKMSAVTFGQEVRETRRYKLGKLLSGCCRHFLLLTATPHNGKEEDFQRFMALIDPDRFEGRPREGGRPSDASDLMRRLVKEQLLRFDGTPLFPERCAYTVNFTLSGLEARLYAEVTAYVREEMDRADRLALTGEERRRVTVGFALTTLQRRLASSPEAIAVSLRRRRERLEHRLREETRQQPASRQAGPVEPLQTIREESLPYLTDDDLEDLDEAPESEVEQLEASVADRATAARSLAELRLELDSLRRLEALAMQVCDSGADRKWEELSNLLQGNREMFDAQGQRRKLIVFTEHRDTLRYLQERLTGLIGRPEAIEVIHGSLSREARRSTQERFMQDPTVEVLLATDAAGEGVNLQRAHLMVNYDLPWNPNRLEQRFGRIHRIGQTEVCHLWNLVAPETREGAVFQRLLSKLEQERQALGGRVFDVLGKVFSERPLRDLLIEAIRYGDQPAVRARLEEVVDGELDRDHLRALLEERALARDSMDYRQVLAIK
ncbi:MAG TPA: helicase-related protein, partial [Chloroflexota bacterium]